MVRIVGILCGSALAISFLIIALGVPEILPAPDAPPAIEADDEAVIEVAEIPVEIPDEVLAEVPVEVPAVSQANTDSVAPSIPEAASLPPVSPLRWYAFWSPFRSELAANGFVSQLQRTTGMDYRVVRVKPGVYEVAFAYDRETDIENKLAAISAATGLEMPDG
jgi:hypothetical protein